MLAVILKTIELKKILTLENIMEREVLFNGKCPYCGKISDFILPTVGQTVGTMLKYVAMLSSDITKRKNPLERYDGDEGKIGRCINCNEVVLQCPKCDHVNRRLYNNNNNNNNNNKIKKK